MMKLIRNFLPCDNRSLDILSMFSLLGLTFSLHGVSSQQHIAVLTGLIAAMQFLGVAGQPRFEVIRVCATWVAGAFWVYYGVTHLNTFIAPMLGIGLLLSFILSVSNMASTWKY